MDQTQRSLLDSSLHAEGRAGGFSFGGRHPEGVGVVSPLPRGHVFPNGAKAAILLTFDVEGDYGNGAGDVQREIDNYDRILTHLGRSGVVATFNIVGQMAEERGGSWVPEMAESGSEIASHGYVHDLNRIYGTGKIYAGHYGAEENRRQVRDGTAALNAIVPGAVHGIRMPYGHFNEYTYDAITEEGLRWASNVGIDDWTHAEQGFGPQPFRIALNDRLYPLVEIPLDSQTFDWAVWKADPVRNRSFVEAVRAFCEARAVPFERTPRGAAVIWQRRMRDAVERGECFTLLCHPINLATPGPDGSDPVETFLYPVIDALADLQARGEAWVPTCRQLAEAYRDWHWEAGDAGS